MERQLGVASPEVVDGDVDTIRFETADFDITQPAAGVVKVSLKSSVVKKYAALIGNGVLTSIAIAQSQHGLAADGTNDATCYDAATGEKVYPQIFVNPANGDVTYVFDVAPATGEFLAIIMG